MWETEKKKKKKKKTVILGVIGQVVIWSVNSNSLSLLQIRWAKLQFGPPFGIKSLLGWDEVDWVSLAILFPFFEN